MLAITISLLLAGKPTATGAKGVGFCFTFAIKFQNRNIPLLIGAKYNNSIITTKCLRLLIENYGVIPPHTHTHRSGRQSVVPAHEETHVWVLLDTE